MFNKVLVAVDGSPPSQRAVEFASQIARQFSAELVLVHVHHSISTVDDVKDLASKGGFLDEIESDLHDLYDPVSTGAPDEEPAVLVDIIPEYFVEKVGQLILSRAEAAAARYGVERTSKHFGAGDPAKAVLDLADREQPDLIAIGSRGLGDLKALILGSVSHKILQDATCPCAVIK